jgi:hypothetical protein
VKQTYTREQYVMGKVKEDLLGALYRGLVTWREILIWCKIILNLLKKTKAFSV